MKIGMSLVLYRCAPSSKRVIGHSVSDGNQKRIDEASFKYACSHSIQIAREKHETKRLRHNITQQCVFFTCFVEIVASLMSNSARRGFKRIWLCCSSVSRARMSDTMCVCQSGQPVIPINTIQYDDCIARLRGIGVEEHGQYPCKTGTSRKKGLQRLVQRHSGHFSRTLDHINFGIAHAKNREYKTVSKRCGSVKKELQVIKCP